MTAKEKIKEVVKTSLADTPFAEKVKEEISVLPAAREEFGDFYTNLAFKMIDSQHPSPQTAALYLKEKILSSAPPEFIEKIEVKNGFVNFFLKREVYLRMLSEISLGNSEIVNPFPAAGKKALIEFVSSNPTGPLTIAHGRQAAFGESLARILKHAGFEVTKEYYLNDGGRQIKLLGESLKARLHQLKGEECAIPEGGYEGEYLIDMAKEIKDENISFGKFAADYIMEGIKKDLAEFNVSFDSWAKESDFLEGGMVEEILKIMEGKGLVYSSEGATWFKSSAYGDEKDRVVIKSDGSYTYLAPDMAYHRNKIDRGYDILVNIVGPDHHGYIPRIKAIVESYGFNPERLKFIIVQLTTLYRGKEKLSMSTRKGQFVSLRQLMDEVGPDASKFFFIFRKAESHLDFDLELATKKSVENPVYYLQYAYVRMKHIIKFAGENGIDVMNLNPDMALLKEPEELSIARKLAFLPDTVESVANTFGVHLLAEYLLDLAKIFHSYYHKHRVVTENRELTAARIMLVGALLGVFSLALELLNISLPDEM